MVTRYVKAGAIHAVQNTFVTVASVTTTGALFILLPIINAIAEGAAPDTLLTSVDTASLPPPPDVVEEAEPEPEEPEPEEEPPQLEPESETLDLSQLELMMSNDIGAGGGGAALGFKFNLGEIAAGKDLDEFFDLSDLDSRPTPIDQQPPVLRAKEKAATPGRAIVIFIVDSKGRVKNPKVQSSSNPALDAAALRTVKKWKFQPGTRKGKPVSTRARQVITFPEQ